MEDNSLDILKEAAKLSPENVPLRRHLASLYWKAGRLDEAGAELADLARLAPGDATLLFEWSRVLDAQGRYEEAAARLQEALKLNVQHADAHLLMARVLMALRQREKAARHYYSAMEIDPTLYDAEFEKQLAPPEEPKEKAQPIRVGFGREGSEQNDGDEPTDSDVIRELGLDMERPKLKFSDVGGMTHLKEEIRVNIIYPFLHPEIYEAYGKKVGGGILLYGPPGCGKTYIARATAGECAARFLAIGIEDVLDMWMGQSERKVHLIFEAARQAAPTVLFFDELDALAGKRSESSRSSRSVVNQLLAETDGAKGSNENMLIIGATNSPWHVDAAFRRPGRFDKVLFVPPPDKEARMAILQIHCAKKPVENIDYEKIAARTKKFSGADLAAVCEVAAEIGLRETIKTGRLRKLTTNDFLTALKTVKPTTEEWLSTARNYALYANQSGLYDSIAEYLNKGGD